METTAGSNNNAPPPATSTSPTPTSKYIRDFESLFIPIKVDELCDKACNGHLKHCQFRSLCWRYFLRCLPEQYDQWLQYCEQSRGDYEKIKAKHLSSKLSGNEQESAVNDDKRLSELATTSDVAIKNKELDEEQQYLKATNQCDHKNVFRTIERDVVRTFPDMEFFRQTEMQGILENVLFNFASENPHLSYKQGMHELLAILLYVLHTDSQNCLINYEGGYANETIATLLDLKYLEHDVFQLFCALMKSIETWYQNDEILIVTNTESTKNENGEIFTARSVSSRDRQQVSSVLGNKLNMISHNIVKKYDLELFNHLEALQIAPQIYGIRWMRLLFGREFEFLDLLTVWDAIICDPIASMSLTEYIFASMLVTIREELVNGDYTDCLNNLMRHQFKDVQYVIKLALHLRNPQDNPRPKPLNKQVATHKSYGRYSPETSLTSKLSQQYISGKQQPNSGNKNYHLFSTSTNYEQMNSSEPTARRMMNSQSGIDQRDSRKIFMTPKPSGTDDKKLYSNYNKFGSNIATNTVLGGARFLNPDGRPSIGANVGSNKLIPTINRFVTSLGQNLQDKTQQSANATRMILAMNNSQQRPSSSSSSRSSASGRSVSSGKTSRQQDQTYSKNQMLLAVKPIKEYEMREMLSPAGSPSGPVHRGHEAKLALASPTGARHALNLSMDTYDDLPSIVDYCWRLLSEQIDSLQRCLPKEKSLHSEDEIFVALAQLKKVRDVLKGSLRLDDELDSPPGGSKT